MQRKIVVREACEHNLRAVDVDLPHGVLVAVSGVSGSGKTSLVLDTIYAEARRRFLAALDQGGGDGGDPGGSLRSVAPAFRPRWSPALSEVR